MKENLFCGTLLANSLKLISALGFALADTGPEEGVDPGPFPPFPGQKKYKIIITPITIPIVRTSPIVVISSSVSSAGRTGTAAARIIRGSKVHLFPAPTCTNKYINQLANPPINAGITKKKIIINACAVTIVLYN